MCENTETHKRTNRLPYTAVQNSLTMSVKADTLAMPNENKSHVRSNVCKKVQAQITFIQQPIHMQLKHHWTMGTSAGIHTYIGSASVLLLRVTFLVNT